MMDNGSQNSLLFYADLVIQIWIAAFCLDQLSSQSRKMIHSSNVEDSQAILKKYCYRYTNNNEWCWPVILKFN